MNDKKKPEAPVEVPTLEMPTFEPQEWNFISQSVASVSIPANSAKAFVALQDKLDVVRDYLIQEGLVLPEGIEG
jgi:hypothetical protein